jgi:hypothetical protein
MREQVIVYGHFGYLDQATWVDSVLDEKGQLALVAINPDDKPILIRSGHSVLRVFANDEAAAQYIEADRERYTAVNYPAIHPRT